MLGPLAFSLIQVLLHLSTCSLEEREWGFAKPQFKQELQHRCNDPFSPQICLQNPLLLGGQTDPRYREVDEDQRPTRGHPAPTLCLPKALVVPATERNRGLAISSGVRTNTMENISDILKSQADAYRMRLKNSPTLF